MLYIKGTTIKLTRGDSAFITLGITDGSGKDIELASGDTVRVQVRKAPGGALLFEGDITNDDDGIVWHIKPENTANIPILTCAWDAQVEFSNGDVFTFIPASDFIILPEVTV